MPVKKADEKAKAPKFPNCTYDKNGCNSPWGCLTCGFNKAEVKRRREIPLTKGPDGLWRKEV